MLIARCCLLLLVCGNADQCFAFVPLESCGFIPFTFSERSSGGLMVLLSYYVQYMKYISYMYMKVGP